jgi:murein L,D-transpeptidase YcbB/YkuD
MEYVEINPTWTVPYSIATSEMLPKLKRNPSAYAGDYEVFKDGKLTSWSGINWNNYGRGNFPFTFRQKAGPKNALGKVKFMFPNTHNIYMHDTPKRELFDSTVRAYSHGCVRVKDPRRFAEIVLGWTGEQVADAIASGRSQTVNLPEKLPVYLHYFTAWPQADGTIKYYDDIYNRDARLNRAFNTLVQVAEQTLAR